MRTGAGREKRLMCVAKCGVSEQEFFLRLDPVGEAFDTLFLEEVSRALGERLRTIERGNRGGIAALRDRLAFNKAVAIDDDVGQEA